MPPPQTDRVSAAPVGAPWTRSSDHDTPKLPAGRTSDTEQYVMSISRRSPQAVAHSPTPRPPAASTTAPYATHQPNPARPIVIDRVSHGAAAPAAGDAARPQISSLELMQFYQRVDTSKLPHVPTILAQYSTEDLLAALTARYGPDNLPRARVLPPAERAAEAKMQAHCDIIIITNK